MVKLDVGADGASSAFTGTIGAVTNLAGGSVTVTAGTIGGGSIVVTAGTVEATNVLHADYFQAQGTIGGTATGTAKAAVSGSAIYVTDLMVSVQTISTVTVSSGTNTVPIWGPLFLAANGGAVSNFVTPIKTTSGSALVYNQSGTGLITVAIQGYVD